MGCGKGSKAEAVKRAMKTVFFMMFMLASLLISCVPLLISIVDVALPCILLSTFTCCNSCFSGWAAYNIGTSVADIPLLSLIRSLAIFCVYTLCGVPSLTYEPYFSATAICGGVSAFMLVLKTCIFFHHQDIGILQVKRASVNALHMKQSGLVVSLFSCSLVLALVHIVVAYKVKCQAQRKMHIHRIDPEAVYGLVCTNKKGGNLCKELKVFAY
ncbi:hypothetical protein L7F22_002583 [Adiantum nelumboides]|nr:hypothetical protein [Adiantum nelumboides]